MSSSSESCTYGPAGPTSSPEASDLASSGRSSSIMTSSSWPASMYSSTCPIWISSILDASSTPISAASANSSSNVAACDAAACGTAASGPPTPLRSFVLRPLSTLADRSGRSSGDRGMSSARVASRPILASFQFSLSTSSGSFIMSSYSRLRHALECGRCPGASICLCRHPRHSSEYPNFTRILLSIRSSLEALPCSFVCGLSSLDPSVARSAGFASPIAVACADVPSRAAALAVGSVSARDGTGLLGRA